MFCNSDISVNQSGSSESTGIEDDVIYFKILTTQFSAPLFILIMVVMNEKTRCTDSLLLWGQSSTVQLFPFVGKHLQPSTSSSANINGSVLQNPAFRNISLTALRPASQLVVSLEWSVHRACFFFGTGANMAAAGGPGGVKLQKKNLKPPFFIWRFFYKIRRL